MSEPESRTETPGRASARRSQQARNPRLRLACLRCQRRKIKCDGELPRCKHCRNAGAACIDGESARLRDLPRGYITNLRDRVKWLESILQEKCPDVDLSDGPAYDDASLQNLLRDETPTKSNDVVAATTEPGETRNTSSHEIGLVSLGTSQDQRYIGPSSGYFLARVMLTKSSLQAAASAARADYPFATELIETVQRPATLPSREIAEQICDAYFDTIHYTYPVLHRPTFMNMLSQLFCNQQDPEPVLAFQVYMVLAIGSIAMSHRLKTRLPSEPYCLAALQYFHRLNVENSLQGLQCLILLLIFTLHSPHTRVNIWYLNYQAIAAVVDLGLQRDITTQSGISLLEQEMRTRIFWVVFMLDRVIATTMGRPIGLRDEACDLRLPRELDDATLSFGNISPEDTTTAPFAPISYSVHLFRLAKLNSEIKYVANSVVRQTPVYAYPAVVDIFDWQNNMLDQMKTWESQIPVGDGSTAAQRLDTICRLQCHTLRMVLLRPSPAIPKPTKEALEACHSSARASLQLLNHLYTKNMLIHSWLTFYAAVLSTLTMLYCVKMVPSIRQKTELPDFIEDLGIASSILSATGEHWSGARKCRDILDELGRSMTTDLLSSSSGTSQPPSRPQQSTRRRSRITQRQSTVTAGAPTPDSDTAMPLFQPEWPFGADGMAYSQMMEPSAFFDDFLGSESFSSYFNDEDVGGIDDVVRNMFGDFATLG